MLSPQVWHLKLIKLDFGPRNVDQAIATEAKATSTNSSLPSINGTHSCI